MNSVPLPKLTLVLPEAAVAGFASLLQHGILFGVDRPTGVLPFLLSLPGFTAEYLENRVQTIFINHVAADNLDRLLPVGSTLALSAAMPGLAGAIFRRQGLHGSLRSQPEVKPESSQSIAGFITLKLFNSIASDRVRDLLIQGVQVSGRTFLDFAAKRAHLFQPPATLLFGDQPLDYAGLLEAVDNCPTLQVKAELLPED